MVYLCFCAMQAMGVFRCSRIESKNGSRCTVGEVDFYPVISFKTNQKKNLRSICKIRFLYIERFIAKIAFLVAKEEKID
jgi:hypothetical protein